MLNGVSARFSPKYHEFRPCVSVGKTVTIGTTHECIAIVCLVLKRRLVGNRFIKIHSLYVLLPWCPVALYFTRTIFYHCLKLYKNITCLNRLSNKSSQVIITRPPQRISFIEIKSIRLQKGRAIGISSSRKKYFLCFCCVYFYTVLFYISCARIKIHAHTHSMLQIIFSSLAYGERSREDVVRERRRRRRRKYSFLLNWIFFLSRPFPLCVSLPPPNARPRPGH